MYQKTYVIGYIQDDVYKPEDDRYLRFTVKATKSYFKEKKRVYKNTYFKCVIFSGSLEKFAKYIKKDCLIYVEGEMNFDKFVKKDGEVSYSSTLIVENFRLLNSIPKQTIADFHDKVDDEESERRESISDHSRALIQDVFNHEELPF